MSTCPIPWLPVHSSPTGKPLSFASHVSKTRVSTPKPPPPGGNHRESLRVVAFYSQQTAETFYEILGVPGTGSTLSDIKKAYKQMARKHHPDLSPPERRDENTQRFIMVHEAYETLSNAQSRALYDNYLNTGVRPHGDDRRFNQGGEAEWKTRWESQLDGLKRRQRKPTSWGARMRAQSAAHSNQDD